MPMFDEGMSVADLREILDGDGIQADDKIYVNSEYGKSAIYSIRRSVPIPITDDEESVTQEDPYVILNG